MSLGYATSLPGIRQYGNSTFTTSHFRFVGLTVNLSVHERALFIEFASQCCFVILTHERMPGSTRRVRAFPTDLVFSTAVMEQERTRALIFHVCSHRDGNYMRLFLCAVLFAFH